MDTNIFEQASRDKFRFLFKGQLSVEDLWDLNLTTLDSIFKDLNKQLKSAQEESLLSTRSAADTELNTKVEIVKHIVSVKLTELAERERAAEQRRQKARIMEVLAQKQDSSLLEKSEDELKAMLAGL